jgi:hypothetical protein
MAKKRKLQSEESEEARDSSESEELSPAINKSDRMDIIDFDQLKHDLCLIKLPKEVSFQKRHLNL